ncbi:MAG TPA: MFS transporter [Pilimelia sp.]|nr:MFS transporter [Pilimelia sp.]
MTRSSSDVAAAPSTWAPLRHGAFRALWLAALFSQIGTWMQLVGAQWLLVDEPNAATLVSLVQTAATLPILLVALPAGVLADSFDRRRLLIAVQLFSFGVAAALAALTVQDEMTPALLLTLTFALGCGTAMTVPTYLAIVPDLVPRAALPAASSLGGISINVARAVGPAIAGLLVAEVSVAAVFALNALTFLVFTVVLLLWRAPAGRDSVAEPFVAALRAGGRYIRHSPIMRRYLLRLALFIVPGVALWALLPLVASERLRMGADGYGLLLAVLGAGAIAGATVMPRVRHRFSENQVMVGASLVYAAGVALAAFAREPLVVAVGLLPAGAAWMTVLTNVNADVQLFLPRWVRARGLGTYQTVFFGGQALGALGWGLLADQIGVVPALLAAAALTAAGAATIRLWPLIEARHLNREVAVYWPEPRLTVEPDPTAGPVVVHVTYAVPPENEPAFLTAMARVRRSRRRTGAVQWGLFRPGELGEGFVELYLVPTWGEHLRQHAGRLTGADEEIDRRARELADGPPAVVHLLPVDGVRRSFGPDVDVADDDSDDDDPDDTEREDH